MLKIGMMVEMTRDLPELKFGVGGHKMAKGDRGVVMDVREDYPTHALVDFSSQPWYKFQDTHPWACVPRDAMREVSPMREYIDS